MINDYLDSVSIVELNVLYITVGPTENGHGWVGDKWARTNVGRIKGVNMYALPHLHYKFVLKIGWSEPKTEQWSVWDAFLGGGFVCADQYLEPRSL
jgi:hypothetical protein